MRSFAADPTFEALWRGDPGPVEPAAGLAAAAVPAAARRYLGHAIAPGTPPATAVRLRMHGEIKLGKWRSFVAEEVLRRDRGFIWRARTRLMGLPVTGSDRWIDGEGSMRWKLLGLVPVMVASGPDISRSALGRALLEAVWLPSLLAGPEVVWDAADERRLAAQVSFAGAVGHLTLDCDPDGRVRTIVGPRWGDPDGQGHRYVAFGGVVEAERSFDGYTIPSQLRLGWHYGGPRFVDEGEFFRVTVDAAAFR